MKKDKYLSTVSSHDSLLFSVSNHLAYLDLCMNCEYSCVFVVEKSPDFILSSLIIENTTKDLVGFSLCFTGLGNYVC